MTWRDMIDYSKSFFSSTITLFDSYQSKYKKDKPNQYPSRWVHEVVKRLRQLSFICDQIKAYEKEIMSMTDALNHPHSQKFSEFSRYLFEAEFFVESFYYIAFRVKEILTHISGGRNIFPEFKNFNAIGLRNVRNHLLEHPEKHGGEVLGSLGSDLFIDIVNVI